MGTLHNSFYNTGFYITQDWTHKICYLRVEQSEWLLPIFPAGEGGAGWEVTVDYIH